MKSHIAAVMQTVLNAPVAARQFEQARRLSFERWQGSDAVDRFAALLLGATDADLPFELEDLAQIGPVLSLGELATGGERALFQPPVPFIERLRRSVVRRPSVRPL